MESYPHKGWYIALVIANFLLLILVYIFNSISSLADALFISDVGDQSDKYYVQITPAGWTFSIWGFIYVWQALWCVYSLVLLCRRTPKGPAYLTPVIFSPAMFVCYMIGNAANIAWLFLFDRDQIEAAFAALFIIAAGMVLALAASYRALDAASPSLVEQNRMTTIWLVRAFAHNGLGIYATWTCIATLLNLAMVIRYSSDPVIGDQTAATVALSVLSAEILLFAVTDLFFLDRYSRYTFTPYMVVIVALIGSIFKNWVEGARNSIFTAVLLAVAIAVFLLKLILTIYRHVTKSKYTAHTAPTLDGYKGGQLA